MVLSPSLLFRQQVQGVAAAGQRRRHCFRRMVVAASPARQAQNIRSQSPLSYHTDRISLPKGRFCAPFASSRLSYSCENIAQNTDKEQFVPERSGRSLSRGGAQSWASGINGEAAAVNESSTKGRRRRGFEDGGGRSSGGGAISFLFGAALVGQAATKSDNRERDDKNESGSQESSGGGGRMRLERVFDLDGSRVGCEFSLGEDNSAGRSTLSVWKVGERDDVTGVEEREDGEHVIVQAERRQHYNSCKDNEEEAKEGNLGDYDHDNNGKDNVMDAETKAVDDNTIDKVDMSSEDNSTKDTSDTEEEEEESDLTKELQTTKKKKTGNGKSGNGNGKEKLGFRDRKIVDYENRIRTYSTPDKIFRYFATLKSVHSDGEIFMTPEDFLRSLTPGVKQPDGLGLDQFKKFDPSKSITMTSTTTCTHGEKDSDKKSSAGSTSPLCDQDSIFYRLGSRGLISFSDYIFLLTILSTSRRQFEIAFRMFDLNGDGDVDFSEFTKVQEIIRQTTPSGKKHRDHGNTGSTIRKMNSALANYFFGENLGGKLTIERFLDFQHRLQSEILRLEYKRKGPDQDTGRISEKQFAELLLTYADYSPKRRGAVLKRVKKKYKNTAEHTFPGISLEDYVQIFDLLMNLEDVEKALHFHTLAGASISESTLKHVAKVTANVTLSDHVVEVLFTIFDEDGDGGLSNREFVSVMKNKLKRGLEKPKDTGLFNLLAAVSKCAVSGSHGLGGVAGGAMAAASAAGTPFAGSLPLRE